MTKSILNGSQTLDLENKFFAMSKVCFTYEKSPKKILGKESNWQNEMIIKIFSPQNQGKNHENIFF